MPPILSLITAEQFKLITEGADLPVFIQGIAGSGKTVVALHRISWLLLEKNLEAKNCLILVKSPLLNSYIKNSCSLIDSDLEEIHTFKFDEWVEKCLGTLIQNISIPYNTENPDNITNQKISTPRSIFRLKNSSGFIHSLKNELRRAKEHTDNLDLNLIKAIYLKALSDHRTIIENDETKLINKELVDNSLKYTTEQFEKNYYSSLDKVIFLLIKQELSSQFENHLQQKDRYEHIFTDEVQDFSLPELLVIMNSVKEKNSLTMVGDVSQSLTDSFPGWNKVLKIWGEIHRSSNTSNGQQTIAQQTSGQQLNEKNIIKLSVSHRSTAQIMQLAEYVRDSRRAEIIAQKSPKEGVRIGRVPIWFRCPNEQKAFGAMSDWVLKAQEKYPNSATAILCKDRATAKYLAKLLEPRFGASVRLVDDNTTTIEEGLLVAQIADIKGLEFFNVLLWNPSKRNYNDQIIDRNLLYTAITRAEENLAIVSYERESEFLPKFSGVGTNNGNELIRGFDLREEDEQN